MDNGHETIEIRLHLSSVQVERLRRFSTSHRANEDTVVEQALDIFFRLADSLDTGDDRTSWSNISDGVLARVWDNEDDAIYDRWRELYGVPAG